MCKVYYTIEHIVLLKILKCICGQNDFKVKTSPFYYGIKIFKDYSITFEDYSITFECFILYVFALFQYSSGAYCCYMLKYLTGALLPLYDRMFGGYIIVAIR